MNGSPDQLIMSPLQLRAYTTLLQGYYFSGSKMFIYNTLILELE